MTSSRFAIIIVGLWLAACTFAFWWFEYRHWGKFDATMVQFDSKAIGALYPILNSVSQNTILVVHFADEDCPCERYRKKHVNNLVTLLRSATQVVLNARSDDQTLELANLDIPATPAVAIWNQQGELAYFGPYSSGMTCGDRFDFVSMVFKKIMSGENPNWINTQGVGCFCPWRSRK